MGKGKGKVALALAVVKVGRIFLEIEYFSDQLINILLRRCVNVLPGQLSTNVIEK